MHAFLQLPAIKLIRRAQFVLALGIFFYAALSSGEPGGKYPPMLLHVVGNFLLITSCWTALMDDLSLPKTFGLCVVLSVLAESAQSLTEARITDPMDFLANGVGLVLGLIVCICAKKLFQFLS